MSKIDHQLNFSPLCRRCHKPVLATQSYVIENNEVEHANCDNPQPRLVAERAIILVKQGP